MEVGRKSGLSSLEGSHPPAVAAIWVIPVPRAAWFGGGYDPTGCGCWWHRGTSPKLGRACRNAWPPRSFESAVSGFGTTCFRGTGMLQISHPGCAGACTRLPTDAGAASGSADALPKKKEKKTPSQVLGCWVPRGAGMRQVPVRPRGCIMLGRDGQRRSRVLAVVTVAP